MMYLKLRAVIPAFFWGTWWPNGSDASDVSDSQACNQCLCGVWVRAQLAALDVAPYTRAFRRGSRIGGFLRALRFPPPSKRSYSPNVLGRRDTVAAVLSPGRVARISQGNMRQKYKKYKYKIIHYRPFVQYNVNTH
jgi:hypothetical protein